MTAIGNSGHAESVRCASELAASLCHADRDREVAHTTRRVVMASLGLLQQQKANRKRNRSVALAVILLVAVSLGPLIWTVVEFFETDAHFGDILPEFGLWACILCPALLAVALIAWMRRSK